MGRKKERYVIVPDDNVFNLNMDTQSFGMFRSMHRHLSDHGGIEADLASATAGSSAAGPAEARPKARSMSTDAGKIELIDSIDLNEATLAAMTPEQAHKFARAYPGLRVKKELFLYPLLYRAAGAVKKAARLSSIGAIKKLIVTCVDATNGAAIPHADLVIVFNRKKGVGIKDIKTDASGVYSTPLPAALKVVDAVICSPLAGYWPNHTVDKPIDEGDLSVTVSLTPIASGHKDALDLLLGAADPSDGHGVKIAVIDAGVSSAAGLNIKNGLNTTGDELPSLWSDNGSGHGTHVAGIISRVAPAAELHVYRVFKEGAPGASEFAIARAVRRAVDEGCDLINLSLGQDSEPIAITRESRRARALGAVCIAATGNDYMSPVSYPARTNGVVAVTAAGVEGSFPPGANTAVNIARKPAPIATTFFAVFSNIGPEVDFIGPGVGIISWVSAQARGVMDGTSMACPAVTGLIARFLSRQQDLLKAERNQQRSDDILKAATAAASPIGFGIDYEGTGIIAVA
jgi:minor extracellular protease Epr